MHKQIAIFIIIQNHSDSCNLSLPHFVIAEGATTTTTTKTTISGRMQIQTLHFGRLISYNSDNNSSLITSTIINIYRSLFWSLVRGRTKPVFESWDMPVSLWWCRL